MKTIITSKLVEILKQKNNTISGELRWDPKRVLFKKLQDHGKRFMVLIVPKPLQNMCPMKVILT